MKLFYYFMEHWKVQFSVIYIFLLHVLPPIDRHIKRDYQPVALQMLRSRVGYTQIFNPSFVVVDAALFLQGTPGSQYVFLETIVEETSDDLRSESDRSGSRASPVGWLATDSESGSVIRVDVEGIGK